MFQTRKLGLAWCCGATLVSLVACAGGANPDASAASEAGSAGALSGVSGSGNAGTTAGASSSVATGGSGVAGATSGGGGAAGVMSGGATSGGATSGGATSGGASAAGSASGAAAAGSSAAPSSEPFSFFLTSVKALVRVSGNAAGFGGDLRFGETGDGAGLRGADKICATIAEASMPANGKTWRAFLSATKDGQGQAVNAIDRIGAGPWYDRLGRLVAQNKTDMAGPRPTGADAAIVNDLPNEDGVPNHDPDGSGDVDNHDTLTGSNTSGQLFSTNADSTCSDWTNAESSGSPRVGHSWPRTGGGMGGFGGPGGTANGSGQNWMSALNEAGCAPGIFLVEAGGPGANGTKSVGDGGGYGGFYCFALTP